MMVGVEISRQIGEEYSHVYENWWNSCALTLICCVTWLL